MHSTAPADLDRALRALSEQKRLWPHVPIPERIALLRRCIEGCAAAADEMAIAGCRAKSLDPESPAGAEEWLSGPVPVIRNLRLLIETLSGIQPTVRPAAPGPNRVRVFPRDRFDRLFYPGVTIDVWLETPEPAYAPRDPDGAVVLVLGAGNVASIGLMDLLYKLFVEDHVVVLKMHPINDYVGPHAERAFAPLIDAGCLRIVYGDAAVRFCNEHVAGTLSAVILADPRSRARLGAGFDRAVADLRYGTVAINQWSAMSYALAVAPWGAYPGHTRDAIGSGIGVVHNTQMLDRAVKSVLDAPLTTRPKPAWFVTHRRAHIVARRLARFEASPSWWRVPGIAIAAYRD